LRREARHLFLLTLTLWVLSFCGAVFGAQGDFPAPKGAINDFAGVIDASTEQEMENLAREVWEKTGTAIVVAVMTSIGDNAPDDYANRLYQAWGIGEKGKDKGVLIFLAIKERKVRIETGYGVEGILPDGLVGEILDKYVLPSLKEGQYGKGLANGLAAVASVIAKDAHIALSGAAAKQAHLQERPLQRTSRGIFSGILLLIAAILLLGTRQGRELLPFLLIMLMGSGRGGGTSGGSGGFGGGFGGFGGGGSGGGGAGRDF
jgi:uncharacterized protein